MEANQQVNGKKTIADGLYTFQQKLGVGQFGDVYKATTPNGQVVVIKQINLDIPGDQKTKFIEMYMVGEIKIMKKIKSWNNPHLLKMIQHYKTSNNLYIVLDYCNGGTLEQHLKQRLNGQQCMELFKHIIKGMKMLWDHNIAHRDLKTENIMIHDGKAVIVDFGLSKMTDKQKQLMYTCLGTPLTMAPEVLIFEPYDTKADIWSLGTILYKMLEMCSPYYPKKMKI